MKALFIVFSTLFIMAQTAQASIICESSRMRNDLKITDSTVAFFDAEESGESRSIASSSVLGARTQRKGSGFTKIVYFEGQKHTIHINDVNNFSDMDDYITIRSQKGHEVIYPLSCERS